MSLTPQLSSPAIRDQMIERARRLRADSPGAWGRMTAHQMVWHVTGALQSALGELDLPDLGNWFSRSVVRYVALHTSLAWPKGTPTSPVLDAARHPPPTTPFDDDLRTLCECLDRFSRANVNGRPHVVFGPMSQDEWQHWGWRHTDHHFRQFKL
ncbi:MAG: DUF1569 domain-containing protein [Gemmatimonadaceae bacterium]